MFPNSKGFFLLELLLSLSALLVISMFLLPIYIQVREQSHQVEIENIARKFMYEELQARMMDHNNFNNYSLVQDGIEYQIFWKNSLENSGKVVCVKVERNPFIHGSETCGIFE
ncbi:competence type IV pilus minor pilin ComGE [Bacillus sp. 1P10SD]|uniref:competence type IV pilus minor pilin ComGE n=1 Tax=Bacillus sp. 1P10SD TaxID=3132265 RepID=UPI0039A54876